MVKIITFTRSFVFQPKKIFGDNLNFTVSRKNFFLSFVDALICIFDNYQIIDKKDYALLPSFYCPDTLRFISQRLKIVFYKINPDFTIDKENYFRLIKEYKPRVIINYNFLGVPFDTEDNLKLSGLAGNSTIIIDDYAHKMLLANEIKFLNKNHFYIDSIRKHSSFLGSHLVSEHLFCSKSKMVSLSWHKIKCYFWHWLKIRMEFFSYIFNSQKLYLIRDKIFFMADALVGENNQSHHGPILAFYLYNFLNLAKIKNYQKELALEYNKYFSQLKTQLIKTLPDQLIAASELTYYPLLVSPEIQIELVRHLGEKNIFIERLWDPPEINFPGINKNSYESFLIFPLNWLINKNDIHRTYQEVNNFFKKNGYIENKN